MRVLGLDVGTKTIGVAVSDELGLAAHPHSVIARKGAAADAAAVGALLRAERAEAIVVGLPLTLEGEVGLRAKKTLAFVDVLKKQLPDTPIETWDERFSTAGAERVLLDADLSRARRKQVIDKQAAAFILQGWLDAKRGPG